MAKWKFSDIPGSEARLKPHAEEWIKNALSTAPYTEVDRELICSSLRDLYRAAGKEPPKTVIFTPSTRQLTIGGPIAAGVKWLLADVKRQHEFCGGPISEDQMRVAISEAIAHCIDPKRGVVIDSATRSATYDATDSATRSATHSATRSATDGATYGATYGATAGATRSATDSATRSATAGATYDATYDATDSATRSATHSATYGATYGATDGATYGATYGATRSATDSATAGATAGATYDATRSATAGATRSATAGATRSATRSATAGATRSATAGATRSATRSATAGATRSATHSATRSATHSATYGATYGATDGATYGATYGATRSATDSATAGATYDATRSATAGATRSATAGATRSATRSATAGATRSATRSATHSATYGATYGATRFLILCTRHWYTEYNGGNEWSAWPAYLSFGRAIGRTDVDYSKWIHYERLAQCGPRYMHPDFVMVAERPTVLDGTARKAYRDGSAIVNGAWTYGAGDTRVCSYTRVGERYLPLANGEINEAHADLWAALVQSAADEHTYAHAERQMLAWAGG